MASPSNALHTLQLHPTTTVIHGDKEAVEPKAPLPTVGSMRCLIWYSGLLLWKESTGICYHASVSPPCQSSSLWSYDRKHNNIKLKMNSIGTNWTYLLTCRLASARGSCFNVFPRAVFFFKSYTLLNSKCAIDHWGNLASLYSECPSFFF